MLKGMEATAFEGLYILAIRTFILYCELLNARWLMIYTRTGSPTTSDFINRHLKSLLGESMYGFVYGYM